MGTGISTQIFQLTFTNLKQLLANPGCGVGNPSCKDEDGLEGPGDQEHPDTALKLIVFFYMRTYQKLYTVKRFLYPI